MIKILFDNTHAIAECDYETRETLRNEVLAYEVPGAEFAVAASPYWDGKVRMMDKSGRFPAGLVWKVIEFCKTVRREYKVIDQRTCPAPTLKLTPSFTHSPRYYQTECAELTDKTGRGVFVLGTGGGKTLTAGMVIARRQVPTLFVTPDTGLREQALVDFVKWFGAENVGTSIEDDKPIIVANIQSAIVLDKKRRKNPALFKRFQMLIVDEFHHSAAKTYQALNTVCTEAYYRYGFTGTFVRPDGADMEMHGVLSNVVYRKPTSELIEEGFLVRPYITILAFDFKGAKRLNYKDAYHAITRDEAFNHKVAEIARLKAFEEGKQTIILVRHKEHGEILKSLIPDAYYLSGDDKLSYREQIKGQFVKKEIRCLIATNIFGEGQDIPSIDVMINARCQKTEIQTSQGIGRVLRKSEGKERAEVFDFLITGQRHLLEHSKERVITYRKEKAFRLSFRRA